MWLALLLKSYHRLVSYIYHEVTEPNAYFLRFMLYPPKYQSDFDYIFFKIFYI